MDRREGILTRRKVQWALLILTLVFIWGHSCMSVASSSAESGHITQKIAPLLKLFVGSENVTEHLVRKLAHFTEYVVLGAQLLLLWTSRKREKIIRSVELGFLVAFLDESIQLLSNRGALIVDVWLDTAGVVFGAAVIYLLTMKKGATFK